MASQPKTKQAIATISRAIHKDALLEMVATGWTQQKIADHVTELTGIPVSQYYVCKTLQSFGDDYQAAKKAQAQYQAERVSALADKVEQGTLDPASARVASDNRKWVASKLDPSAYGDKVAMDVQLTDVTQMHLQAMRDAMRVVNK
jgi:hypothetical protein